MAVDPRTPPSRRRLLLVGLVLPAALVLVDQLTWVRGGTLGGGNGKLFFAWLVIKSALLSWCAGRFLGPTVYGWIVFFWCQALLDVHTLGSSYGAFGYEMAALAPTLVSAQIGFLAVWTFLGEAALPWRITSFLTALAAIVAHSHALKTNWNSEGMPLVQWLAAGVVALIATALRWSGFQVRRVLRDQPLDANARPEAFQFGVKHMLIWTTALTPLLFVMKGLDDLGLKWLTAPDLFPAAMLGACIALVTLASIWGALGAGPLLIRLIVCAVLIAVPGLLMSQLAHTWAPNPFSWSNIVLVNLIAQLDELWWWWFACVGALLAGMLLFLRASGYRLAKKPTTAIVDTA
jgi:hypothetical protein